MSILRYLFFFLSSFRKASWDTGISPPELHDFIATHSPGRALDLGCGTGTNVITLAQAGWDACGVDFIQRSIQKARKKSHLENIPGHTHFSCDSVARLTEVTGTFDLILDIGCYQGLSHADRIAYLNHIRRLLSNNGEFMLYGMVSQKEGKLGLTARDMDSFNKDLFLIRQTTGADRSRVSTWLWFQKNGLPEN